MNTALLGSWTGNLPEFMNSPASWGIITLAVIILLEVLRQFAFRHFLITKLATDCYSTLTSLASAKKSTGQSLSYSEIESETYRFTDKYEESLKLLIGSFTALGMILTFIGLTMAVGEISNVINNMEANDFNNVVDGLSPIISGMALAFYSSLWGLILSLFFSLINGVLKISYEKKTNAFILLFKQRTISEYAPATTESQVEKAFETQQAELKGFLSAHINETEKVLRSLSQQINNDMENLHSNNNQVFSDFTTNVFTSMESLKQQYESTYQEFSKSMAMLTSNLEHANGTLVCGTETMQHIQVEIKSSLERIAADVEQFSSKVSSVSEFSAPLEKSASKFEEFTREMLNAMDQFVAMLSGSTLDSEFQSLNVKIDANESMSAEVRQYSQEQSKIIETLSSNINDYQQKFVNLEKVYGSYAITLKEQIAETQGTLNTLSQSQNTQFETSEQSINKVSIAVNVLNERTAATDEKLIGIDKEIKQLDKKLESKRKPTTLLNADSQNIEDRLIDDSSEHEKISKANQVKNTIIAFASRWWGK